MTIEKRQKCLITKIESKTKLTLLLTTVLLLAGIIFEPSLLISVKAQVEVNVLNLEPCYGYGEDRNNPPLPIMPFLGGYYDSGTISTTTKVKITVSFPNTPPSVIPAGNYLAGGIFLQGQDSVLAHTDYGFLASISLDNSGNIQYNMAFYVTREPAGVPPTAWYEIPWRSYEVISGINTDTPVTLIMEWDSGWVKWSYVISGVTYQADSYYAFGYSGSIIQQFYTGWAYDPEVGASASYFYYQFGIYSKADFSATGWMVRLEHPMYYSSSGQWTDVSRARTMVGGQSYLDHWWRWGGEGFSNARLSGYDFADYVNREYVVEFYGAVTAFTPFNWLLWGRRTDWFTPTGYSDPEYWWNYETNAYDNNENSYALSEPTKRNKWTEWLYLTQSQSLSRKIRILNKEDTPERYFYYDIYVLKDGVWTSVYYGGSIGDTWKEISFDVGWVSQIRIRMKRATGPSKVVLRVFEADFGNLVEEDWFNPTGNSDPNGGWSSETRAYDNDLTTYAETSGSLSPNVWSSWLYLTHSAMTTNRVRLLNQFYPSSCRYEIHVLRDGLWVVVWVGALFDSIWTEMPFYEGMVTQMRIRVQPLTSISYPLRLYEADFGFIPHGATAVSFSLREHATYRPGYSPDIRFLKPSPGVLRIDSYQSGTSSMGHGAAFVVIPRDLIDGKYIRFNWSGYFSSYEPREGIARAWIYDGEYDRASDTDFPEGTWIPTKGAGLLQTLRVKNTCGNWGPETVDVMVNVADGVQPKCTIFFHMGDGWNQQTVYLDIDWFEINEGAAGSGNLYVEGFESNVEMERTGTYGDYGHIGAGIIYY